MAGVADGVELMEPGTPGAVQCSAPGCSNWFVKRSGRHIYCKAADCTYRRDAPPSPELEEPTGAAAEMLRRLQESEEPEVGLTLWAQRLAAAQQALRAGDASAFAGALIDVAKVSVRMADRVSESGDLPTVTAQPPRQPQRTPGGLVHAVLASHHRTFALGAQRVELIYAMISAKELHDSAGVAVAQTQGSPAEEQARETEREARLGLERAERALQSVEAAWRERGLHLEELRGAAAASVAPSASNGSGRGPAA